MSEKSSIEWREVPFLESIKKEASNNKLKIQKNAFLEGGKFPIIDQGDNYIAGYTNDSSKVYKGDLPVVIFGDHTRILKFINFEFALGADGVKILVPSENISSKYLFYAIKNLRLKTLGYSRHYKLLKEQKIMLPFVNGKPDIKEQERLASIIEDAEKAKETGKKAEELLAEYLKSVFHEIFKDQELVGFTKEDFEIIDGDRGQNYPKSDDFSPNGYCLFLNTGNVRADGFNFEKLMFITKEKDEALRKGKATRNDVILTTRGTVGNTALYDDSVKYPNVRINSGMVLLRTNQNKILPKFLFYLIQMPIIQNQFEKMNSGTAQPQLPITNLRRVKVIIPNLKLQKRFIEISNIIYDMKEKTKENQAHSKELFNSLMSKAFKGELA